MTASDFESAARAVLSESRIRRAVPLAPLTTLRVGGKAEWLADVRTSEELTAVVAMARAAHLPITLLGGGSNVVVSDDGVAGLVIRAHLTGVSLGDGSAVRAEAGVTINGLVRWLVGRGLRGLESWAGTPGTVGGAVHGNAHWQGRNIGDLVTRVGLVSPTGEMLTVPREDMAFAYDTSRLQKSGEVLVWAEFGVSHGTPDVLREHARASLAFRKRTQPLAMASAGCAFRNPDPATDRIPDGVPPSAGALVDRAGLKGFRIGGASVSETHANFIVNDGTATAADVRAVIETARRVVEEQFGVTLRDEVVYLGTF